MLNTENLMTKMLEHFPRWMDIRKRAKTSIGGQLLESVAEETATLKQTLEDFKKDFFIESYFGKEEDIIDFVYKIQVGKIDINVLKIISHNLTYTEDLNVFYKQTGVFYYENGYLFFRLEDIQQDKIEYTLNEYYFVETPTKMHVWNVFDEFATFVGLERHQWETNQQLEKRILNVFKDKMNNSKEGLAHAIYTELMVLDPTLNPEEIKVEGITPENLRKKYDDFSTVLEKLSTINKDCYKHKAWDIDPWFYNIRSIDYIPHAWDVALEAFKDGVGKEDDLKILLSTANDTTNASVLFYKKSSDEIDNYLKTHQVNTNIELKLTHYNEELKPISSRYKITASQTADITHEDIAFQYSDVSHKQKDYDLSQLIAKDEEGQLLISDVTIEDYTLLPQNKRFKLKFEPIEDYQQMKIPQCDFIDEEGNKRSLLKADDNFELLNNELVFKHCKCFANTLNDFVRTTNLEDSIEGLIVNTASEEATAMLNIDGMGSEHLFISYGCDLTPILHNHIVAENFNLIHDEYVSYSAPGDTKFIMDLEANILNFKVVGHCQIKIYENGELTEEPVISQTQCQINTGFSKDKIHYYVEILSLNNLETLKVSNLQYANFDIEESLTEGTFATDSIGTRLPNIAHNDLHISLKSHCGKSPYIKGVYIGSSYPLEPIYETSIFESKEASHIHMQLENLKAHLICIDDLGNELLTDSATTYNYRPYLAYRADNSAAYIELDLNRFIRINKITTEMGTVKTVFKDGKNTYIIALKTNNVLSSVFIDGVIARNIKTQKLTDLFHINEAADDKLYITNLFDGFIVEKEGKQFKYKLSDIEEIRDAFKYGMFNFLNVSKDFNQSYIRDVDQNSIIISSSGYNGSIKNACIKLKDKQIYIAYNEHQMIQQRKTMIQIEDTFSPFIPQDHLFYYEVTSMSPHISITFHDFDEENYEMIYTNLPWTVGKKYLCLEASFDITDSNNFLSEEISINKQYKLQKTIPINYMTELDNGSIVNLCKYAIKAPEGIQIEYSTINPKVTPIESSPEHYGSESMFKQYDGFNKLAYSNIDQIVEFYGGTVDGSDYFSITSDMYTLLKEEGIIVWHESAPNVLDYSSLFILYTIKIPQNFIVTDDLLYEKTKNTIEGYSFIKRLDDLNGLKNNDYLDLSKDPDFTSADKVIVHCTNPSFDAYADATGVRFKKTVEGNALYAKAGYYYIDGLEYYLFAEETSEKTDKIVNVELNNITKDKEGLHLQKTSHNYINNSLLFTEGIGNVYTKDFTKQSHVHGISAFNALTACSSFNHWNNVGCDLSLTDAHNGIGLVLTPFITEGYAYIEITQSLYAETLVSLYCSGTTTLYIGKERKQGDLKYPNSASIDIIEQCKPTLSNPNIVTCTFSPEEDYSYYLIAKGAGIIDDIIICEATDQNNLEYHKKNITSLGLTIQEKIIEAFVNRLFFYNTKGYKNLGAEMDEEDTIINSALINWGLTKIKDYNEFKDWNYCDLTYIDIENNMLISKSLPGYVMTEPIFTGDLEMLKSLSIKINDVSFEQTSGFVTYVYASDDYDGVYELKASFKENIGIIQENEIKNLKRYIKIKIDMPPYKIINTLSVFAEYKTSEDVAPVERIYSNGQLLSEIYDGQYQAKYKLNEIKIDKLSNIKDVELQIRASKANKDEAVWTDWKTIDLSPDLTITNAIIFEDYRFFQLKVSLKQKDAYIKINYLDLKVVK